MSQDSKNTLLLTLRKAKLKMLTAVTISDSRFSKITATVIVGQLVPTANNQSRKCHNFCLLLEGGNRSKESSEEMRRVVRFHF